VKLRQYERNGRTDGQTDRIAISIPRVSMLTRDKKSLWNFRNGLGLMTLLNFPGGNTLQWPKRTERNLTVRNGKSEAEVTKKYMTALEVLYCWS